MRNQYGACSGGVKPLLNSSPAGSFPQMELITIQHLVCWFNSAALVLFWHAAYSFQTPGNVLDPFLNVMVGGGCGECLDEAP
jgi:hypothetical protein